MQIQSLLHDILHTFTTIVHGYLLYGSQGNCKSKKGFYDNVEHIKIMTCNQPTSCLETDFGNHKELQIISTM